MAMGCLRSGLSQLSLSRRSAVGAAYAEGNGGRTDGMAAALCGDCSAAALVPAPLPRPSGTALAAIACNTLQIGASAKGVSRGSRGWDVAESHHPGGRSPQSAGTDGGAAERYCKWTPSPIAGSVVAKTLASRGTGGGVRIDAHIQWVVRNPASKAARRWCRTRGNVRQWTAVSATARRCRECMCVPEPLRHAPAAASRPTTLSTVRVAQDRARRLGRGTPDIAAIAQVEMTVTPAAGVCLCRGIRLTALPLRWLCVDSRRTTRHIGWSPMSRATRQWAVAITHVFTQRTRARRHCVPTRSGARIAYRWRAALR
jgi:hypothetical protein